MAAFPASSDKFLEAVAIWDDGTYILGASCLTGRYWSGSIWCFRNVEDFPCKEKALAGVETESGICDIVSLGQDKVMLGLDSGAIELMKLTKDPNLLDSVYYTCEHDDLVSNVDILADQVTAISCSLDRSIKIWDLETFNCTMTFSPAHGDMVNQVCPYPSNHNVFLSCSKDYTLRLWDLRAGNRACILSTMIDQGKSRIVPTSVACQPGSTVYAVGLESGEIRFGDLKFLSHEDKASTIFEPKMGSVCSHDRAVHRMQFSIHGEDLLASCAQDNSVVVTSINQPESPSVVWKDITSHSNCVRDIQWHPHSSQKGQLVSCAWDNRLKIHTVKVSSDSKMDSS